MIDSTLAPRANDQGLGDAVASDPFATPTLNPADLPTPPAPAAQLPYRVQRDESTSRPSTLYGGPHHEQAAYPYKSASMSSAGNSSTMTPISSIDLEKASLGREIRQQKHHSISRDQESRDRRIRDPEKAAAARDSRSRSIRHETDRVAYLEEGEELDERELQEKKAGKILLFLAGPVVVLSFLNAIWTFISLFITAMAQPVRLCARRPTFGQQLGGLLGPALNLQLRRLYTPLTPHADEDTSYRPGMLLVVQLLSPFLSLGMMVAAWVVAVFWLSSAVVGDPAGTDKRDDGKETVLVLRGWWETWLEKAIQEE
ncbi:hypothetical protein CLAFUW4_02301 [Fulvia fulva]|uniref:Uncharacterized protein n=1 Tax=Passalora fulva TaxID=5499 RepID=A0A9Q8L614_PASFU|nr:uncharacterized protein CLAFUR5_02290 [Fulvia fulva]KAK4635265.1 hypothetical protein CLAFUR4_02296 [Fulvia fulva]KAK4637024.1 hypothetical protein CLAFUR0_02300 [Fulvia fulva]UJO11457.1 hypothetical protein CLAFUR5_02290 [Fulvia fulva]WPV10181.1 hypothetical protein CLAFUW4_02301 [Fulvia fulva]WPV23535.1 hypothetical protein CLAFUW7_02301 [Fulvia fulva]